MPEFIPLNHTPAELIERYGKSSLIPTYAQCYAAAVNCKFPTYRFGKGWRIALDDLPEIARFFGLANAEPATNVASVEDAVDHDDAPELDRVVPQTDGLMELQRLVMQTDGLRQTVARLGLIIADVDGTLRAATEAAGAALATASAAVVAANSASIAH